MIFTGQILDATNGQPVSFASIEVTDKDGVFLGYGVAADANGFYSLDVPQAGPGMFFRISSAEYLSVSVPYENFVGSKGALLTPKTTGLDPVVVTAQKKNAVASWLPWAAAGLGLFILLNRRKR